MADPTPSDGFARKTVLAFEIRQKNPRSERIIQFNSMPALCLLLATLPPSAPLARRT